MNNEYKTNVVNKFITKSKTLLKDIQKPEYKEYRKVLLALTLLGVTALFCIRQSAIMIDGGLDLLYESGVPEYQIHRLAGALACLGGGAVFCFGLVFPAIMSYRMFFRKTEARK